MRPAPRGVIGLERPRSRSRAKWTKRELVPALPQRQVPVPAERGTPYEWLEVFDQLTDPVFIHDKEFRVLRCNAAYAACAQLPMHAIIGKPYWQVFPKVSGPLNNCVEALESSASETKSEFTTEAGQVFLTHDITAHKATGEFWYSRHLMENVTATRLQQEIERLKTSFSDAIIGSAPDVFLVLDAEGKLVRWNAGLNRLTARSDANLSGVTLQSLVPEDDRERIAAKLAEAFATGRAQGEVRLQFSSTNVRDWVFSARRFEVAGLPYVVGFCIDKTEVRKLENELMHEKAISDTIIESAPGPFFVIDQQAKLVRWNKHMNEISGLSEEQLRGSSILAAIHEEDRPLVAAKFLSAFATGYAQMEVRVPTTDRGLRHFFKTARRFMIDGVPYLAGFCVDVTDRKRIENALGKEKAFSDALIESVPGAFYVVDAEGNYFRWNSYLKQLTGLSDRELQQRPSLLTIVEEDRPLAAATMKEAFEKGYAQAELHVLTCDRGVRLYFMTARRFEVADTTYLVGVGIDTTEWLAKMRELEHDAWTDPLTQVANRGHFLELARQEFARCRRYGHPLSIWMLDIDHFKAVNDTYGHHAGDTALQSLVSTSRQALRDWDILGRMGGEEFAVVLPETETTQALLVAERLRQTVASVGVPLDDGKSSIHLTVSIGIAAAYDEDTDFDTLLDRADAALYQAKRTGRDKVCLAERPAPA
ncbi:MAG: diguanylate cyclase [Rhodocyclales bacterium]|nr:diguanylate cyclase [Rhodocyclales bacterium]